MAIIHESKLVDLPGTTDAEFHVTMGAKEELNSAVLTSAFQLKVKLSESKLRALGAIAKRLRFRKLTASGGIAGQVVLGSGPEAAPRRDFLENFVEPADIDAETPAPHSVVPVEELLQLPGAEEFREDAGTDPTKMETNGAAYFLAVCVGLIYGLNIRLHELCSDKCREQYKSLAGSGVSSKYSAGTVAVSNALMCKASEKLDKGASEVGAAIYAMSYWMVASLLTSPKICVLIANTIGDVFLESFFKGAMKREVPAAYLMYRELDEARWIPESLRDEVEPLSDPANCAGSIDVPGSPLAEIGAMTYQELKNLISAKTNPAGFASGQRKQIMDRYRTTVPALQRGNRRSGGSSA